MRSAVVAAVLILFAAPLRASVLDVPGTFPTIQQALDAAQDGDTILVQAGTYAEALVFPNVGLTLESAAGAATTTIDATGLQARVIHIPEAPGVVVRGFTITGGRPGAVGSGGGVLVGSATATIESCVIAGNLVEQDGFAEGGGVSAGPGTTIVACEIRDNHVTGSDGLGGGVAGGTVIGCLIAGNSATRGGGAAGGSLSHCTLEGNLAHGSGGGFYNRFQGGATDCLFLGNISRGGAGGAHIETVGGVIAVAYLARCTFIGNVAALGGGGASVSTVGDGFGASVTVLNCIFVANQAPLADGVSAGAQDGFGTGGSCCFRSCTLVGDSLSGSGALSVENCILRDPPASGPFQVSSGGILSVSWSNVEGGWPGTGNFDADPLFENPAAGDFHLSPASPCISAGDPAYVPTTGFGCFSPGDDVDGQPRPLGGRVDVGADEVEPDCNLNGIGDLADIAAGSSTDCDGEHTPDECQPVVDCNGNGQFDACDIASGRSGDCDEDGVPDECSPFRDCNLNGIPDGCDIAAGSSTDCDHDGVPDECEAFLDCNGNGALDACDIDAGTSEDCNGNGVPDECDIASGASLDANGNGWPDECEATLHVPSQHATIQDAIDAAEDGDTIVLAPGTYAGPGNVNIDFHGKEVMVRGADPPDASIIDGSDDDHFAKLGASEAGGVLLHRLTFRNGMAAQGGALLCDDGAVLEARDCAFEDNRATISGGAVMVRDGASATFRGCTFTGNQAQNGGAVRAIAGTVTIEHGSFTLNTATGKGGAISAFDGSQVSVHDSILWHDSSPNGDELFLDGHGTHGAVTWSDVEGGLLAVVATGEAHVDWGPGLLDAEPLFADAPADLRLLPGSPCINAGDPAGPFDGDGSPPDMGALAYQPWTALGGGIAGTFGLPVLTANGPLTGGSIVRWSVSHGGPGHPFSLVVGFAEAGLPFHGGVLWPEVHAVLGLSFDAQGVASAAAHWPYGAPAGSAVWLQAWIVDGGAVGGFAASGGVKGVAP